MYGNENINLIYRGLKIIYNTKKVFQAIHDKR